MELTRLLRILRDRWIVVIVLGLLGSATAIFFTLSSNNRLQPRFEATAPIRFELTDTQDAGRLTGQLEAASNAAAIAAQDVIAEDPANRQIDFNEITAQLLFIASSPDREQAIDAAEEMRQTYLEVDPLAGGVAITERLAIIEQQAEDLEQELAALTPQLNPEEVALQERYAFIDEQLAALRARLLQLTLDDVTATSEQLAANQTARTRIEAKVAGLLAERSGLPPLPDQQLSSADELRRRAIQTRLDSLAIEYESLYLRQLGVTSGGTAAPSFAIDLTPAPSSPVLNGLLGAIAGVGVALFGIVADTRIRRPAWLADDVPLPVLGELPARRGSTEPGLAWYDQAQGSSRKQALQGLRNAIEGRLTSKPVSLAIGGLKANLDAVHAMAADLAASFASAGWSVLLVDAEMEHATSVPEFDVGRPGLSSVLRAEDPDDIRDVLTEILADSSHTSYLTVVPSGETLESAADAVSGSRLDLFLQEAMQRFDLVMLVGGDVRSPATQALFQRVDRAVLCLVPGRAPADQVSSIAADLSERRVSFLGVAFLARSGSATVSDVSATTGRDRSPLGGLTATLRSPRAAERVDEEPPVPAPAAIELEDSVEPTPLPPPSPRAGRAIRDLADDVTGGSTRRLTSVGPATGPGRTGGSSDLHVMDVDEFVDELLDNLVSSGQRAYQAAASYVTGEIVAMLNPEGPERLPAAFVPLVGVKGHPSVGANLAAVLRSQLGARQGNLVEQEIRRILGEGVDEPDWNLDEWIASEFFHRHVQETQRQPVIWHLSSQHGSVQVLVDSRRFTRVTIDQINESYVDAVIDNLDRGMKIARRRGRPDRITAFDEQLLDARMFEMALSWLHEGTTEPARIVYPNRAPEQQPRGWDPIWSEGVLPNLAPLQRLGLLPFEVLTEDEMNWLRPAG